MKTAKEMLDESIKSAYTLQDVYNKIQDCAKDGLTECSVNRTVSDEDKLKLKQLGYSMWAEGNFVRRVSWQEDVVHSPKVKVGGFE